MSLRCAHSFKWGQVANWLGTYLAPNVFGPLASFKALIFYVVRIKLEEAYSVEKLSTFHEIFVG